MCKFLSAAYRRSAISSSNVMPLAAALKRESGRVADTPFGCTPSVTLARDVALIRVLPLEPTANTGPGGDRRAHRGSAFGRRGQCAETLRRAYAGAHRRAGAARSGGGLRRGGAAGRLWE